MNAVEMTAFCIVNSINVNMNSDYVTLLSQSLKSDSEGVMIHSDQGIIIFRIWYQVAIITMDDVRSLMNMIIYGYIHD